MTTAPGRRRARSSWSPLGLLSGNVIADRIELRGGHIYRQPDYKPAPDQADEPFAWPDLPVDIDAQSLTGDLTIDAAVVGEAITATLNGRRPLRQRAAMPSWRSCEATASPARRR